METSQPKKKRGPKKKLSDQEKCRICEKLATAIHYNCVACEGCKGFFRRTVVSNKTYPKCQSIAMCKMTNIPGQRTCQYCRYNACIKAGMRPEMISTAHKRKRSMSDVDSTPKLQKIKVNSGPPATNLHTTNEYPPKIENMKIDVFGDLATFKLIDNTITDMNIQIEKISSKFKAAIQLAKLNSYSDRFDSGMRGQKSDDGALRFHELA